MVDVLILGAGWTSTFLIPLLSHNHTSYAATTTTGHDDTIPFKFDPDTSSSDPSDTAQYRALPYARTILITFPLRGAEQPRTLIDRYTATHLDIGKTSAASQTPNWILLGSTGIWTSQGVTNRHSAYDTSNARAQAEDALLALKPHHATVLNLAGLFGGARMPKTWLPRVAKTVEAAKGKTSLHLIHGEDVARLIVAGLDSKVWEKLRGGRWICTDLQVYDWWNLMMAWGGEIEGKDVKGEVLKWMREENVGALPREKEDLGRWVDARETWEAVGSVPVRGIMDVLG